MADNRFMWSHLVHLGWNCWNDMSIHRGRENRSTPCGSHTLLFDRPLWDAHMQELRDIGINTLIVDVADAMRFESHPEIAIDDSWTHYEMKKEVEKLKAMGFEVIPKLNFSAGHDVWLKDYSHMLCTDIYRQVCRDLIDEVCEVFKPNHFHLGMDEETAVNQRNQDYVVIRRGDFWWRDFYHLVDSVERNNATAWIWSDRVLDYEEEFFAKMPTSVVQNNWYYWGCFKEGDPEFNEKRQQHINTFYRMDKLGMKQVPAGSIFFTDDNFEKLTKFALENISRENLMGMMQTVWERVDKDWMHVHKTALDNYRKTLSLYGDKV